MIFCLQSQDDSIAQHDTLAKFAILPIESMTPIVGFNSLSGFTLSRGCYNKISASLGACGFFKTVPPYLLDKGGVGIIRISRHYTFT